MVVKFNLEKAIKNEEYAKNILINEIRNIYYDDYIFALSTIYGSNINLKLWIQKFNEDPCLFDFLVDQSFINHCLNWNEAVIENIDNARLYEHISFDSSIKDFKTHYESRKWVIENLSSYLLKTLYYNQTITSNDIIQILNNFV